MQKLVSIFLFALLLAAIPGCQAQAENEISELCPDNARMKSGTVEGVLKFFEYTDGYYMANIVMDNGEEVALYYEEDEEDQFFKQKGDRISVDFERVQRDCSNLPMIKQVRILTKSFTASSDEKIQNFQNRFGYTPGIYVTCHVNFPEYCKEEAKKYKADPDSYTGEVVSFFIDNDMYNVLIGTYDNHQRIQISMLGTNLFTATIEAVDRNTLVLSILNNSTRRYEENQLLLLVRESLDMPKPVLAKKLAEEKEKAAKEQAAKNDVAALVAKAESGDSDAQFRLGVFYLDPQNIDYSAYDNKAKNTQQALDWLSKAAEKKQIHAMMTLAYIIGQRNALSHIWSENISIDDLRSSNIQFDQDFYQRQIGRQVQLGVVFSQYMKEVIGFDAQHMLDLRFSNSLYESDALDIIKKTAGETDVKAYEIAASMAAFKMLSLMHDAANRDDPFAKIFLTVFREHNSFWQTLLGGLSALANAYAIDARKGVAISAAEKFVITLYEKCGTSRSFDDGIAGQETCAHDAVEAFFQGQVEPDDATHAPAPEAVTSGGQREQ